MLTMQEVFNRSAIGLLKQGERSENPMTGNITPHSAPNCKYRAANGNQCGVGFLFTDEAYNPHLEDCDVSTDCVLEALRESGVPVAPLEEGHVEGSVEHLTLRLLLKIQNMHDTVAPYLWEARLTDLAKMFSLTMPDPLEYSPEG